MTQAKTPSQPPVAPRRPHSFTRHGITVTDDYAWLKDAKWQEVLRDPAVLDPDIRKYLDEENVYTESLLGHTASLQKTLVREMRGRIKEDDSSVPSPDGPFAYFRRFRKGGQHGRQEQQDERVGVEQHQAGPAAGIWSVKHTRGRSTTRRLARSALAIRGIRTI